MTGVAEELSPSERAILRYMAEAGTWVNATDILLNALGYVSPSTPQSDRAVVRQHMYRIRRKLGATKVVTRYSSEGEAIGFRLMQQ